MHSGLPTILLDPPWQRKKRGAPAPEPVVLTLAPLPFEERLHWLGGLREHALEEWARRPKGSAAAVTSARSSEERAEAFLALPAADMLPVLSKWSQRDWLRNDAVDLAFAVHGMAAVPHIVRLAEGGDLLGALMSDLARVESPRLAVFMAHHMRHQSNARRWFLDFPKAAAVGLVPIALGPSSCPPPIGQFPGYRFEAIDLLRWLARHGKSDEVLAVAADHGAGAEVAIREILATDPLVTLPEKAPKLPPFWTTEAFPAPRLRATDAPLPPEAMTVLGVLLSLSRPDDPHMGVAAVRDACDPASLDAFSAELVAAWVHAGAPAKADWAFHQVALIGRDEAPQRLAELVRTGPKRLRSTTEALFHRMGVPTSILK